MTTFLSSLRWLCVCLGLGFGAVGACATAPDPTPTPLPADSPEPALSTARDPATSDAPPADDPMFVCSADADCVLVDLGPCDICNGGEQIAAHRNHQADALAKYGRGSGGACTERGCHWSPTPICDAGTCARLMDFDSDPATPPTKVVNFASR